ncbi:MAG: SusC/RagA family TonB-linked outer membrane protein [Ferruginibacter sp.]|nr:SusC/RagA family TonB-linked outer membrane protein [Ferruginibacter sp.]
MKRANIYLLSLMLLCMCFGSAIGQQKRTITGIVRDSSGNTIPGVSINIKGTKTAAAADAQGNFKILVPGSGAVLVFTSVGFQPKEVRVGDESFVPVSLQNAAGQLNEVVVTGFGARTNTRKLAYAVQEIKGEEITKTNNANIVNSLQGKVAGVMVNQGVGGPQSSSRIRIRGNTSISSSNTQPLFVVDGVLIRPGVTGADSWGANQDFGNIVKDLNPDDYASFTVLKGSAASALYGSDGQNGVILITTKKGTARKGLGVSFSHAETFDIAYKLYDLQNKYGSGIDPTFQKVGGVDVIDPNWGQYFSFGPKFNGQMVKDLDGHMMVYQANDPLSFFQTGRYINTNVAMEGGNDRSTFRFSYSNLSNNSVMPNNKLGRNSFNLRATQKLGSIFNMDVSINYTMSTSKNPLSNGGNTNPLFAFTYNGTRSTDLNYWANNYIDTALGGRKSGAAKNPYGLASAMWNIYQQNTVQKESNLRANVDLTATITSWLNALVRTNVNTLNIDFENSHRGEGAGFSGSSASYRINTSATNDIRVQGLLNANKDFGRDFSLTASVGGETNRSLGGKYTDISTSGGFRVPDQYLISNSVNTPDAKAYSNPKKRTDAVYVFGDLSWKNALTLSFSARNDWNSTLTYQGGNGGYSYFYPSVGLAYVFTDMESFKSKTISFGKIRASYGYTGYGTDPYVTNRTGRYGLSSNYVGLNGTIPVYTFNDATLPNLALKNQLTKEMEFGTELKFFNNRLGIDAAYYKKNTYNQIFSLPAAAESGVGSRIINAGNIQNQGIEIVLTGTPIRSKNFQWNTTVNFTRNRNKIIELAPGVNSYELELGFGADVKAVAIPGSDYGILQTSYGYASYQKKDASGQPIASPNNGKKVIGDPAYADFGMTFLRSGTYDGSTKDLGSIMEKYLLSNLNNFSYKNFVFGFQVDAKVGGLMGSGTHQYGSANGSLANSLFGRDAESGGIAYTDANGVARNDGIIPDGVFIDGYKSPLNGADIGGMTFKEAFDKGLVKPKPAYQYYDDLSNWGGGIREYSIFENTWVSLREISAGYNFPVSVTKKMRMNSLRLSAVARNVVYLYKTAPDGINPEGIYTNRAAGFMEYGGYPYVRSLGFTLNASF